MTWLIVAVLVYAVAFAPMVSGRRGLLTPVVAVIMGVCYVFLFYCLMRGLTEIGVLHR